MKKIILITLIAAALALVPSCVRKKPAAAPGPSAAAAVEPLIDGRKAKEIDSQLAKYEAVVSRYLADAQNADALAKDTEELAAVSEELAGLAVDFNADQQKKYEEITAKMSSE